MLEALRAWARKYTEQKRYSPVGVAFHWVMAALVLFQIGWGFWTDAIMPGGEKVFAYQVHSAVGLPILILALMRGLWRLLVPGPVNDADNLGFQTTIAHFTHVLFYLCFFGLPISGWVMWSSIAGSGPLRLAGVLPWPQLPLDGLDQQTRFNLLQGAESVHRYLVILLLVLIPAHVGAALKHHFWDRHDVLRGMLPDIPNGEDSPATRQRSAPAQQFRRESEAG